MDDPKPDVYKGESCYLCEKPILPGEPTKHYYGPFLIHVACIQKIFDHHGFEVDDKK